ncbi:substrate-binding domain-containing protein [Deinococcus hopiensis]|uniref:Transcriptional regulator, LacI family n=1 Tax=Deinococcus hopiensis KR-140 TaxID=695939 RepID=A0A1W1VX07_9DEIO|nr:substrate-binding domain-containing protein [Deinococcus hopiensis]SMB97641.1 transcriptional regulator, LacI family [Deinococcus hopiensis KR-140]
MPESLTLEQVARAARVSTATVSRIINGTGTVSAHKRAAVMEAIERLGYRPNMMAQALARGSTMSVGVLTPDIASPFYSAVLRGVERGFGGSGYHPVFASEEWRVSSASDSLDLLVSRRVDAMIVLGGNTPLDRLRELAGLMPLVVLGRELPGLEGQCLEVDQTVGAEQATHHLLALGHRRIVHLAGPEDHADARARLAGYRRALRDAGVPEAPELIVPGDFSEAGGHAATEALLAAGVPFTAIFAANDQSSAGAQLALFRRGLRVPTDLSVVGFDDIPGSAFERPPLTTVRQPTGDMGQAAAAMVLALLRGEQPSMPTFRAALVERESTAPVPTVRSNARGRKKG